METGNEAGKESLGTRLRRRDWERGWERETGNEAGKERLETRLGSRDWE